METENTNNCTYDCEQQRQYKKKTKYIKKNLKMLSEIELNYYLKTQTASLSLLNLSLIKRAVMRIRNENRPTYYGI